MICPTCQANNPATARFCMTCGTPLFADQPTAVNATLPNVAFTPPSEAARQTGGLAPTPTPPSGYVRYTHPVISDNATLPNFASPAQGYVAPTAPPPAAPQSQAAMWMAQAQPNSGYYYPPAPIAQTQSASNFALYVGAAFIALIAIAVVAWLLLSVGNGNGNGNGNGGSSGNGSGSPTSGSSDNGSKTPSAGGIVPLTSACTAAVPTPTSADEQAVVQAIEASNQDQIQALKTLNTDGLDKHRYGEELDAQKSYIADMKSKGFIMDSKLECIDYVSVTVDGSKATATTVERWSGTVTEQSSKRKLKQPATNLHETYTLQKQDGVWKVGKVVIAEEQNRPTPDDGSQ